jgi:hypothetical protein
MAGLNNVEKRENCKTIELIKQDSSTRKCCDDDDVDDDV